jgi:hypothetical protein
VLLGALGGGATGLLVTADDLSLHPLLVWDAVVSWLAAVLLVVRRPTPRSWRLVALAWAVALPLAYAAARSLGSR